MAVDLKGFKENESKLESMVDFVCDQTGDCGELIDLDDELNGKFVSQATGGVVEFNLVDVIVDSFLICDQPHQFIKWNQKPVGIYNEIVHTHHLLTRKEPVGIHTTELPQIHGESIRPLLTPEEMERFVGHLKPEPLKDTINWERDERQFYAQREPLSSGHDRELRVDESRPKRREEGLRGESIRRLITPEQEKRFEKVIELYIKEMAKPADAERLSKGLETLNGQSNREEGLLRGEESIRMYRPSFEEATESFLKSNPPAVKITPEQIERLKELILEAAKKE